MANQEKITPGPWVVHRDNDSVYNGPEVRSVDYGTVAYITNNAEVYSDDSIEHEGARQEAFETSEANARLIAAAPDLLEAVLVAKLHIGKLPGSEKGDEIYDQLKAAIAKADSA